MMQQAAAMQQARRRIHLPSVPPYFSSFPLSLRASPALCLFRHCCCTPVHVASPFLQFRTPTMHLSRSSTAQPSRCIRPTDGMTPHPLSSRSPAGAGYAPQVQGGALARAAARREGEGKGIEEICRRGGARGGGGQEGVRRGRGGGAAGGCCAGEEGVRRRGRRGGGGGACRCEEGGIVGGQEEKVNGRGGVQGDNSGRGGRCVIAARLLRSRSLRAIRLQRVLKRRQRKLQMDGQMHELLRGTSHPPARGTQRRSQASRDARGRSRRGGAACPGHGQENQADSFSQRRALSSPLFSPLVPAPWRVPWPCRGRCALRPRGGR